MRRRTLTLVAALAIALSAAPAWGASPGKTTTTTIPTIYSPSHKLYKAGEFCSTADLGKRSHGSGGTIIKCEVVNGHNRWEKV